MTDALTGVDIIGALVTTDDAILAMVEVGSIKAGILPDDTPLNALLVRLISSVERQQLKRVGKILMTDRVSVTARAGSYVDQTNIIRAVREACAGQTGAIGGAENVAILNAGTGPDLNGPAASFEQSIDFRVNYTVLAGA